MIDLSADCCLCVIAADTADSATNGFCAKLSNLIGPKIQPKHSLSSVTLTRIRRRTLISVLTGTVNLNCLKDLV